MEMILCENCNREFEKVETCEVKITKGGVSWYDYDYKRICPDCEEDLGIENE